MDERETDRLLGELFKRNAPYVNEAALRERVNEKLPQRSRRSRRMRRARTLAVAFASIVLIGGAAFGAYRLVDYVKSQRALVITDLTLQPGDGAPPDGGTDGTSVLAGLLPVAGTAVLEEVKSEGITEPVNDVKYTHWIRGQVQLFSLNVSQPGTSGTVEITSDLMVRNDGSADITGSWILSNDQGTWECDSWVGYVTADGAEQFGFGSATGTGGYEGLMLYLQWRSTQEPGLTVIGSGPTQTVIITGWIQSAD